MAANDPYTGAALRMIQRLRAMHDEIEDFDLPPTPLNRHTRPSGPARYPNSFFDALASALETSRPLAAALEAAAIPLTPAAIRDMLRYDESYQLVAEEAERFARGVRYTISRRREKIGRLAAAAYAMAKGMNLHLDMSQPVPEVEAMRRAFGPRRRKAAQETDEES